MAAKHIQIAQTQGPKAGFNAYIETLERSGLDTAHASLEQIRAQGNKKAQFDFYCAKFGSKFGATPTKVDETEDLQEQLRVLQARLAELQGQGVGVVATDDDWDDEDTATENAQGRSLLARALSPSKPKTRRSSGRSTPSTAKVSDSKENLWRPWAITRFGIPTKVGGTFTYKSKRANKNTVHQVTRVTEDGVYARRVK